MKVLIVGSTWVDDLLSVAEHGFSELGHETEIFDDNIKKDWALLGSRILGRTPFRNKAEEYFELYRDRIGEKLIKKIEEFKADLVFVVNGFNLNHKTVSKIRKIFKIPVALYVIDDPLLRRTWMHDIGAYSHIFVIDDSWMGYLEFFNPEKIFFLPQCADHRIFKPTNIKEDYDIGFGGNLGLRMPNAPSGFLRAQILNFLAEHGYKIIAFAPGIKNTFEYYPALKNIDYFDGYKSHKELNELYNRSKIVLSIHSPQFKTGLSPRVFEAAFAKSFQLIEYKKDIKKLLPGNPSFKSNKELLKQVKFYLNNSDKRHKISEKEYQFSLKHHTFKSRAQEILYKINKHN